MAAGGSTSLSVSVSAVNGFGGDVSLGLSGLSAAQGTWSFSPQVVAKGAGTAQLSVTPAASIAPGTYPLTITATSGPITRTATVTLVVSGPSDFTVSSSPSARSVTAGGTASFTAGVSAQNGFTGDVPRSRWAACPRAVGSAAVTPAVITAAGTAQLTVTTSASATPGTYPLTVTGGSGSTVHTASVTLTVTAPPDFSLGATPSSRTVSAGAGTTYSVAVGASNGFAGSVALSVGGVPSSVGSASLSPSSVSAGGSSLLTVTTYVGAPVGSYSLTITGTSGSLQHNKSVTLTVGAPDFAVSASPSSATIYRGQTASYTVAASALGGFTGSVSLSVSGSPAYATASWVSNPITTPGSTTLRVRTSGWTPRGTFTLRVTGTSGALSHQVTVTLVVR